MADSILRLKVESQEYDNKLKQATNGLTRYVDECRKVGGTLEVVEKETLDYVRALGQMDTTSRTATGKLAEMKKTFTELSAQYKQMTDAEKQSPFGKALAASLDQLKGRIHDSKSQLDDINKSINGGGGLSGVLDNLASKFTVNIDAIKLFNLGLKAAEGVLSVAKDAFFASEATVDEWGRVTASAQSVYEGFLNAINTGDISGYLNRIDEIVDAARKAYDELDRLGTMKTIQAPQTEKQNAENTRMRTMLMTGRYIAPAAGSGLKATMAEGTLLTPEQMRRIEQQLQGGMQTIVKLTGNELKQTGKAIDAYYNKLAKQNGMTMAEFKKGVSSMSEFDKRIEGAKRYAEYERAHTTYDERSGISHRDRTVNPYEQYKGWSVFRVDKQGQNSYNDLVGLIRQQQQQTSQMYSTIGQAYRTINRAEGTTVRNIMGGGSGGGGGKGGGKTGTEIDYAPDSIKAQQAEVQRLTKLWQGAGESVRDDYKKQLEEAQYTLDKMTGKEKFDPSKMKEIKGTSLLPEINDSSIDAQTKKVQQLQEAWRAAADDDSREKIKKEIEEQQYVLDRMTGKRSSLLPEINDSTIDAQTKKVQQLQEAWRAAADDDSRKKIKEELESAQKVLDNMNISAKKPVLRDPLEGLKTMKQSIQLELKTEAVKVDENTLHTLIKDAIQNGINGMDIQFNAIGEKIGKGIDVPESAWDKIIEEYNSVREQLGMEPITIDIKTGNMKEIGNDAKVVKGSFKEAASAVGSLGSALSGLDDPGAKIAGTVAQAIANIALGFSSASSKEGKGGVWYWIAATAAGLATMISTISSIHAATKYAEGGMIKGNSYSGDNILGVNNSTGELVGLNAGEIVLNRAAQGNLAASLQGSGGGFNGQIVGMIEGEKIVLVANRYFKRSGQGEIVTWKN